MQNSHQKLLSNLEKLRPYQKKAVDFFINNKNVLLADEMGLGKTVQTLVACDVLFHKKKIFKILVVCPASLTHNWYNEITTWCPSVSKIIVAGSENNRQAIYHLPFNIYISSYEQIRLERDFFISENIKYDLVILDEAQRIKNKNSSTSQACKLINRNYSWALTGTPVENNIEELISIFSFVEFGVIHDSLSYRDIKSFIKPFFLRRTKKEVLKDLPPIINQEIRIELSEEQKLSYAAELNQQSRESSRNSDSLALLAIITKLKQICNYDILTSVSSKYDVCFDILTNCMSNGKKILIFSQYVQTLKYLKFRILKDFKVSAALFHGSIDNDKKNLLISNFEKSTSFEVMLISLKAGGVGLNLNSASYVIMYDRWWNPAVENQAIHRAHRFGKNEPLNVYKLISENTIEERINSIIKAKTELFEDIIENSENAITKLFTTKELLKIIYEESK